MNTEEELLADALIEIISWVKSNSTDGVDKPLLVGEMIAYGRGLISLLCFSLFILFGASSWCSFKAFKAGHKLDWRQRTQWVPQLAIGVAGCLTAVIVLLAKMDEFMMVWFAPRMYVIEKITQIVIYES